MLDAGTTGQSSRIRGVLEMRLQATMSFNLVAIMWAIIGRRIYQNTFELGSFIMPNSKNLYPDAHTPCAINKVVVDQREVRNVTIVKPMAYFISIAQINNFLLRCKRTKT